MYAFNAPLSGTLAQLQRLINTGTDLFNTYLFSGGHSFFTVSNKLPVLKRLLEELDEDEFLKTFQSLSHKETQGLEFLRLHKKLREASTWQNIGENLPPASARKIAKLKAQWQHQAPLSHCTTEAIFALESLLLELMSLIDLAEKKLKNPPQGIQQDYANYLSDLKQEIQQQLGTLAEVLFYRIKLIFVRHTLTEPNSLQALLADLQDAGVNTLYEKSLSALRTNEFMAENGEEGHLFPLAQAFALIGRQGNRELNDLVRSYLSLRPKQKLTLEPFFHGKIAFLVPETLKAYVPQKPRILGRLFPGYKFRYEFFHDKAPLLVQLAALNHKPPTSPWNLQNPDWQNMVCLQEALETELQLIASQKRSWFSWIWNTTQHFLADWQQLVKEQQRLITQK